MASRRRWQARAQTWLLRSTGRAKTELVLRWRRQRRRRWRPATTPNSWCIELHSMQYLYRSAISHQGSHHQKLQPLCRHPRTVCADTSWQNDI